MTPSSSAFPLRLEGEKIGLETFRPTDITAEYISWLNDPVVMRFSNQRFVRHSAETCIRYLSTFEGSSNHFLKIVDLRTANCLGTMTAYVSVHHQVADMGILVGPASARGRGVGREAWSLLLGWLLHREDIRKVTGGCMRANHAMVRIMEQCGMALEAVRPQQELLDGAPQDLVYYGRIKGLSS